MGFKKCMSHITYPLLKISIEASNVFLANLVAGCNADEHRYSSRI